jgi:hypothetical protein
VLILTLLELTNLRLLRVLSTVYCKLEFSEEEEVVVADHLVVGVDHLADPVGAAVALGAHVPRLTEARNMVTEATAMEAVLFS